MGAVGAFDVSVTVGGELQILVVGLRRLEGMIFGPVLQRCEGCDDLVGVDPLRTDRAKERGPAFHRSTFG